MENEDVSNNFTLIKHQLDSHVDDMSGYGYSKDGIRNLHKQSKDPVKSCKNTDIFSDNNPYPLTETTKLTHLRTRNSLSQPYSSTHSKLVSDNIVFLERLILPNDTLQSFALQFNCSVNDLKRANNLIKEQEFFALRQIKIPVKKYGLLTEVEEELKRRPAPTSNPSQLSSLQPENSISFNHDIQQPNVANLSPDKNENNFTEGEKSPLLKVPNQPSIPSTPHKNSAIENNDASRFLKSVDKEILNTVKKAEGKIVKNEVLEEVVSSLGSINFQPLPLPRRKSTSDCDGSSWGLTWQTIMASFGVGMVFIAAFIIIKEFVGL